MAWRRRLPYRDAAFDVVLMLDPDFFRRARGTPGEEEPFDDVSNVSRSETGRFGWAAAGTPSNTFRSEDRSDGENESRAPLAGTGESV